MDVQDIMGVQTPKRGTPRKTPTKMKRPDGMSREVFALTGGATPPPLVPEASINKGYKEKRKISDKKVSWLWRPIIHPARPEVDRDKPFLYHWVKAGEEEAEYAWAKFDKKLAVPKYTDEQYTKYFQDDDWTREETDTLLELCERFDLRFIVIHDRFPNSKRSIEDLKERYYTVARKLLGLQLHADELAHHPVFKYPFNKGQEIERKAQFERLYSRTREQVAEEEMLVEELKKIDKAQKKAQADRQKVAKLAQSIIAMPGTEPLPPPLEPPTKRRKKSLTAADADHFSHNKRKYAAAAAAQAKTPVKLNANSVSLRTAQKVEAILVELGIAPSLNPTTATVKAFNDLRQDIVILLDLQNHLDKKEYEVAVLEKQKRDLLALDLLAAHRESFAQGRRKRSKKRKLDDDAEYEPTDHHQTRSQLPDAMSVDDNNSTNNDGETPWKKTVGRRGSRRTALAESPSFASSPSTSTTPSSSTTTTTATTTAASPYSTPSKPRRGRGRPRAVKKEKKDDAMDESTKGAVGEALEAEAVASATTTTAVEEKGADEEKKSPAEQ